MNIKNLPYKHQGVAFVTQLSDAGFLLTTFFSPLSEDDFHLFLVHTL